MALGSTVGMWDLTTGRWRTRGSTGRYLLDTCEPTPDGIWLVTANSIDREIRTWDLRTGDSRLLATNGAGSCAVSPDGSHLVSAGDGLRVWDLRTGEEVARLRGHEGSVRGCAISPNGALIASVSGDRTVRIWDLPEAGHRVDPPTEAVHGPSVEGCAVSPDGSWIVCGSKTPVALGDALAEPGTALSAWGPCVVSADGKVAVSRGGGAYTVWDPATGVERHRIIGARTSAGAGACALGPDGSWLVGEGDPGTLKVWDLDTVRDRGMFRSARDPVTGLSRSHSGAALSDCCVGPDGRWIVSADAGGNLKVWDAETAGLHRGVPAQLRGHVCAASPDGSFIVAGRKDGGLSIVVLGPAEQLHELGGHKDAVLACTVTPDASLIASTGNDRALRVWQRPSGHELAAAFLPRAASIAAHPWKPWMACLTALGPIFVELIGIAYGPLAVTARGPERQIRCPACATIQTWSSQELGAVRPCLAPACAQYLRVGGSPMRIGPPAGLFSDVDDQVRGEYYDTL